MTILEGSALAEAAPGLTVGAFIREVGARFAANEALVFDDPLAGRATVRWTYAELLRQLAGAVAVPLSTFAPRAELAWFLDHSGIDTVLTQSEMLFRHYSADVRSLKPDLPLGGFLRVRTKGRPFDRRRPRRPDRPVRRRADRLQLGHHQPAQGRAALPPARRLIQVTPGGAARCGPVSRPRWPAARSCRGRPPAPLR